MPHLVQTQPPTELAVSCTQVWLHSMLKLVVLKGIVDVIWQGGGVFRAISSKASAILVIACLDVSFFFILLS